MVMVASVMSEVDRSEREPCFRWVWSVGRLVCSFVRSFILSLKLRTRSFVRSFVLACLFVRSVRSLVRLFVRSSLHSFVRSTLFVHSFHQSFDCSNRSNSFVQIDRLFASLCLFIQDVILFVCLFESLGKFFWLFVRVLAQLFVMLDSFIHSFKIRTFVHVIS